MKLERNEIGMKREVFFLSCHVPVFDNSIKKKKKKNLIPHLISLHPLIYPF